VTRKDEAGLPYRHLLTSKYTFRDYVQRGMPASSTEGSARASAPCRHMCESERVAPLGFVRLVPMSLSSAMGVHGRPLRVLRTGFDVPTYLNAGGSYEASTKGSTDFRKSRLGGSSDRLRV
jgi:hypothetical protein